MTQSDGVAYLRTDSGVSDSPGRHEDDTSVADRPLTALLCMYYPHKVTADLGPTMLLPGSHRKLYTPSQANKPGSIKGRQKLIVEAGTQVIAYTSRMDVKSNVIPLPSTRSVSCPGQ